MCDNLCLFFFFFFQAEDGIRDLTVTGVQTCALPIFEVRSLSPNSFSCTSTLGGTLAGAAVLGPAAGAAAGAALPLGAGGKSLAVTTGGSLQPSSPKANTRGSRAKQRKSRRAAFITGLPSRRHACHPTPVWRLRDCGRPWQGPRF